MLVPVALFTGRYPLHVSLGGHRAAVAQAEYLLRDRLGGLLAYGTRNTS
jgi:hypothetical protein